jgi:hypothetical protein
MLAEAQSLGILPLSTSKNLSAEAESSGIMPLSTSRNLLILILGSFDFEIQESILGS